MLNTFSFIFLFARMMSVRALYASPVLIHKVFHTDMLPITITIYEFMINAVARCGRPTENTDYERTVREIIHTRCLRTGCDARILGSSKYAQLCEMCEERKEKQTNKVIHLIFYFLVRHSCLHLYQWVRHHFRAHADLRRRFQFNGLNYSVVVTLFFSISRSLSLISSNDRPR